MKNVYDDQTAAVYGKSSLKEAENKVLLEVARRK
jgi:hypothetical protein